MKLRRRELLRVGMMSAVAIGITNPWQRAFAGPADACTGPYGLLGAPDANGIRLPYGFTSRLLATTDSIVAGTDYIWHGEPDGAACFAHSESGWVYVSNSELNGNNGGAGALRFGGDGEIIDAYRICLAHRSKG